MKKGLCSLLMLIVLNGFSQIIEIPDVNLKNKLLEANSFNNIAFNSNNESVVIDLNNDGEIQQSEALLITRLEIANANISSLDGIDSFENLFGLNCEQNQLTSVNLSSLQNLVGVNCKNNQLTSLILPIQDNLRTIECSYNQLTNLNLDNLTDLTFLFCDNNLIETLDLTGAHTLRNLQAFDNSISNIIGFEDITSITNINLGNNNLNELIIPSSFVNLGSLGLSGNNFSSIVIEDLESLYSVGLNNNDNLTTVTLSNLPNHSITFSLENSNLVSLNINNIENLVHLDIENNQLENINLTELPNLRTIRANNNNFINFTLHGLQGLQELFLTGNPLNTFEIYDLPQLDFIQMHSNELEALELDGTNGLGSLETIDMGFAFNTYEISLSNFDNLISFNGPQSGVTSLYLENLPSLNNLSLSIAISELDVSTFPNLEFLYVDSSDLEYINYKNGKINNNIDFGVASNLKHICADDFNIQRTQNSVTSYGLDNVVVNSYCTFVPGGKTYEIKGHTIYDLNNDGCSTNDPIFPSLKLNAGDGLNNGSFWSDLNGEYNFSVYDGTHTVTPIADNPNYVNIQPISFSVDFPTNESPFEQDICISANGNHNDLDIQVIPQNLARPGFDADYKIIYTNNGTTTLSGSISLEFANHLMNLASSIPEQNDIFNEELLWDFADLLPFESREILITFSLNTPTDIENPLVSNDILSFNAIINPIEEDENQENNVFTLNQTVVNSYDPNDKTCLQGNSIVPEMVGKYVNYLIRFENTGNAEAINIVVKDIINTDMFDIQTLQPLGASHDFFTRIKNNNEVEFVFENINLPFDDTNNDGHITFKIKTLETLEVGETFENNAEIYFDFNFPIITNTAVTYIETLATNNFGTHGEIAKIYPNPASSVLNIKTESDIKSILIFDVNGKLVSETSFIGNQNQVELNIEKLVKGVYMIHITTEKGVVNEKVLKK